MRLPHEFRPGTSVRFESLKMSYCFYFLLKSIQTCKEYVQPRNMQTRQMTSFFHLFFKTPSVYGIDLYLKIFKINFRVVHSDL